MRRMPWLSILFGLAATALVILGLVGVAAAITPGGSSNRFDIPPDQNTGMMVLRPYSHFSLTLFAGARVTVNWTVTSGSAVAVYLMDEATFLAIALSGPNASTLLLGSGVGMVGSFGAPVAKGGGYQLVVTHAALDLTRHAMGNVSVMIAGRDLVGFAIGLAEVGGGALTVIAAAALWRRPRKTRLVRRFSVCPTCGTTAKPGADYCPGCGTKLRVPVDESGLPPPEPGSGLE